MLTDDEIMATARAAAETKMLARGYTAAQIAGFYAATTTTAPTPNAAAAQEASMRKTAEYQLRSMGIDPTVSDELAAQINLRASDRMAAQRPFLDDALAMLQARRTAYLADPLSGIEVIMDCATGKETSVDRHQEMMRKFAADEVKIMEARLRAGQPAELPTPKTSAQLAQERFAAELAKLK